MITVTDIIRHIEQLAGHALYRDEGIHHGVAGTPLSGVTVAWMATADAIDAAGAHGHQLLICHESLYFPYDVVNAANPPPDWPQWKVNRERRQRLDQHHLACLRIHGSADEICIFDVFVALLELGDPVAANGMARVYEIPECSFSDLVARVKRCTGMAAVRVADAGQPRRRIRRIGLPWGGLGLFVNVGYQQRLVELGCDAFIAGESDNYGFRFAVESGIPMIETSHEVSENPGLRRLSALLAQAFPTLDIRFYENPCIWREA